MEGTLDILNKILLSLTVIVLVGGFGTLAILEVKDFINDLRKR